MAHLPYTQIAKRGPGKGLKKMQQLTNLSQTISFIKTELCIMMDERKFVIILNISHSFFIVF